MTIEERANAFAQQNNPTDYGDGKVQELMANKYFAYRKGALDQNKIDIERACEWFSEHIIEYVDYAEMEGWNVRHTEMHEDFRKAMEE